MPTAKKLPSGSWRCQIFSHYEYIEGKKVRRYESFTSKDSTKAGKKEAERMAAEWQYARKERASNVTFADAVESYIASKEGVLSPSTIRGYRSYQKHHLDDIGYMSVRSPDLIALQRWLSDLRSDTTRKSTLTAKTIKDIYGLVNAAYKMYSKADLGLTLPTAAPTQLHTPTDAEIKALLEHVAGTELELAILLSAFCSLRRGEICALEKSDLSGDVLTVSRGMVRDPDGLWVIRQPKTPTSVRRVIVPKVIQDKIVGLPAGRIMHCHPDALSNRFKRAINYTMRHDLTEHIRFHDLRHYYASIAHALGVPDVYIMQQGGWKTDNVMKRVYRDALSDRIRPEAEKISGHAEAFLS